MIALIAKSRNDIIGKDGELPWNCPEDLKFFKGMTLGRTIVVGRTTFQSLPPLKDRRIIVLTNSIVDVAELYEGKGSFGIINDIKLIPDNAIICGGGMVYDQLIPKCSEVYLTTVHQDVDGDVMFNRDWLIDFDECKTISESAECDIIQYVNSKLM